MHCHERLKRERALPSRKDAAWQREFDCIEEVNRPCSISFLRLGMSKRLLPSRQKL